MRPQVRTFVVMQYSSSSLAVLLIALTLWIENWCHQSAKLLSYKCLPLSYANISAFFQAAHSLASVCLESSTLVIG